MSPLPPPTQFISSTGVRIYRIPCQVFETLSARVHLLLGAGPPTLVDAGSVKKHSVDDILAGFDAVRHGFGEAVQPGDIRRIIITHGHVDHFGGLPDLRRAAHPDAEVALHTFDAQAVASFDEYMTFGNSRLRSFLIHAGVEPTRREELIGMSHLSGRRIEDVPVTRRLNDGDVLDGLRIIHTPGHSPGHICIGVGNILLSGDHILARTVPQQWPECTGPYTGLGHYLESIDKIQRIPGFEIVLPGHESVIRDLYSRINTIRSAHQRRLDRLLTMLRGISRPLSIYEISKELYPEITGFRAVLAVTDVGARVDYLQQRGQVRVVNLDELREQDCPVYRFTAT
jgi:glyoxylase-like metal-dependent hydrolase (beta-lactamase superfamily II)